VVVFSRWGKVAAASTATELIVAHDVRRIVFTGIAGALIPGLAPGDIVVADRLYQHDLDASPFFPPTEIPLLGVGAIAADPEMSAGLLRAAAEFLTRDLATALDPAIIRSLRLDQRHARRGDIASGDSVIGSVRAREAVLRRVPSAVCVEMEGAAVAQVCHEHGIPFACVRTISDAADEGIHDSFKAFLGGPAAAYSAGVLSRWLAATD
jgi:adenosylhomocysteine nucleosidase